jgi:TetR/AcrR family transcriptional repressor of nem operon
MDAVARVNVVPSYSAYLEARLADQPPPKKGLRTRARLIIAALKMFDVRGYAETRVADIAGRASVAEGSFYIYFKDKAAITVEVLTGFFGDYASAIMAPAAAVSGFSRIQTANRLWIALCRANPGVMHCSLQVGDHGPEIAEVARRARETWQRNLVSHLDRARDPPIHADLLGLLTFMLAGMTDDLIRKLLVAPDPSFLALLERLGADDEALADAVSLVWHQLLNGPLPDGAQISPMAASLAAVVQRL